MCTKLRIEHWFAPVCYPQYNGQVKVMNITIFTGIKKNLLATGTQWYKELDRVLWSYRTTPSNSTGETLISLVYDIEAVLPIEVMEASQPKNKNKLNPKWEGPYRVRRVIGPRTYELEELSGKTIDHTWHTVYLKKYYI
ncbi:hypothetical protein LIER_07830 [Lithospermum erythrorhizon]|uniref:Tf2-1-like SH3-like domain-containing protein n=1 Tax=Lithospermum erythrorhizon TaxID=34254 RepID=A0AAV3PAN5_LITER